MTSLSDSQLASVGMTSDIMLGFRAAMKVRASRGAAGVPMPDHFFDPRNASRERDFQRGISIASCWRAMRRGASTARRTHRNHQFRTIGAADAIDHAAVHEEAFVHLVQAAAQADGFIRPDPMLVRRIVDTLEHDEKAWSTDAVTFYEADGENGILSNTHPSSIRLFREFWTSAEALYQAQKHPAIESRDAIREAPDAIAAKVLSHQLLEHVHASERNRWRLIKITAMARVAVLRANQDAAFREFLLSTGESQIVELTPASSPDPYWGAVEAASGLVGINMLGRIHMIVRTLVRDGIILAETAK